MHLRLGIDGGISSWVFTIQQQPMVVDVGRLPPRLVWFSPWNDPFIRDARIQEIYWLYLSFAAGMGEDMQADMKSTIGGAVKYLDGISGQRGRAQIQRFEQDLYPDISGGLAKGWSLDS